MMSPFCFDLNQIPERLIIDYIRDCRSYLSGYVNSHTYNFNIIIATLHIKRTQYSHMI